MAWDSKIFEAFAEVVRSPRMALVLVLSSGAFLFMPRWMQDSLSLAEFLRVIRPYAGVLFVLASVILCVNVGYWVRDRRRYAALFEDTMRHLSSLSLEERGVLGYCLVRQQQSLKLPMGAISNALVGKGLLVRMGGVGNPLSWSFTVPHKVWEVLQSIGAAHFVGEGFERTAFFEAVERGQSSWFEFPSSLKQ